MIAALVDQLASLMETSDLRQLDYEENGIRISLTRRGGGAVERQIGSGAGTPSTRSGTGSEESGSRTGHHALRAGLTGTFYRAAGPGSPPFVAPGSIVAEGDVIGILEAMKMMTPVECDRGGRILSILDDGSFVNRGDVLAEIETETDR